VNEPTIARSDGVVVLRAILWVVQSLLGAILGFHIADASVNTHVTVLEPGGRASRVRVEVRILDFPIHEESGWINTEDGIGELRTSRRVTVSTEQFLLVIGIIALGAIAGAAVSVFVGMALARSAPNR
jgi:hypothetical protein